MNAVTSFLRQTPIYKYFNAQEIETPKEETLEAIEEGTPLNASEEEKWRILLSSSDYIVVYPNMIPVKKTDCEIVIPDNPIVLAVRNFARFGQPVALPEDLNGYFAYGNGKFSEAQIIIFADSNHSNTYLTERRVQKIFQQVVDNDDTILMEGLSFSDVFKAKTSTKKFILRGMENDQQYEKSLELARGQRSDPLWQEEIVEKRNHYLVEYVQSVLATSNKVIIYLGEGHINRDMLSQFSERKFVVIYDREIVLTRKKEVESVKDYYSGTGTNFWRPLIENGVEVTEVISIGKGMRELAKKMNLGL